MTPTTELDALYGALADPTRRSIIERLGRGEATVAELRAPFTISAPAISKHLRVLEAAGIVERRAAGRNRVCRLRRERLVDARRWLHEQTEFWESTLDSLGDHLNREADR
ncbi:MAG: metalloregulator ArsR/SmtB family transcription factor [Actinomycetota bacterium]